MCVARGWKEWVFLVGGGGSVVARALDEEGGAESCEVQGEKTENHLTETTSGRIFSSCIFLYSLYTHVCRGARLDLVRIVYQEF